MEITADLVKELRYKTGAGVMDCKNALRESDGDMERAIEYLRKKGQAKAERKIGRVTGDGVIGTYIHAGSKIGVLLEVNCETDFVAKTPDFQELAKNIAMQIAATNPICVRREDLPEEIIEREKRIYQAQAEESGKPEKVAEKIVEGKLKRFYQEACLIEQQNVRDESQTIEELVKSYIDKFGENITLCRFVRYQVGEEPEKK